jgi:hypothetical protein
MARISLEEGREEIALLLKAGENEFDNGNPLVALSILFETQCLLSEILQSEMEKVEGSASTVVASRRGAEVCTIDISSKRLH